MISYAQNFEDVVLARVFNDVPQGFYVDVGANHPEHDSVTRHFSDNGWHGINVEPGRYYADLVKQRPRDINLNLAISDTAGEATFYEGASPGLAGLTPTVPDSMKWIVGERAESTVKTLPLETVLEQHAVGITIDFLSVDVEGHEAAVLSSNDWSRHRPRVVVVEATEPGSRTPAHESWEPILLNADYIFAYFDGLNRFYLRREDGHLMNRFGPPCVFDRFVTAETAKLRAGDPVVSGAVKELTVERDMLARQLNDLNNKLLHFETLAAGAGSRSLKLGFWMARRLSALKRRVA
jgi:FkbM family methyltransferase